MTKDTFSNLWIPISRCRSYGADRMFQARYYKDFAPTERAWPPAKVQTAEAGAKRMFLFSVKTLCN